MSRARRIRPLSTEKHLDLREALELMRIDGHRLMLMHCNAGKPGDPTGKAYYVMPGGYINATDALKIIERPDVMPQGDGLFPGISQTWKMGA